jgi:hypothetical protein
MPLTVRQILEYKAWPKAEEVFGYINKQTPRTSASELTELRTDYEKANCPNITGFIDIIQFDEAMLGFAISYNFSLVPCLPRDFKGTLSQEVDATLLQQDLLIGSRWGKECASFWLTTISKSGQALDTDELQVIDKIFGSAIKAKSRRSRILQKGDLIDIANGLSWLEDLAIGTKQ